MGVHIISRSVRLPLLWHTDNYAASLIVKNGSRKPELQRLSEIIFDTCQKANIQLEIKWIPRECITFVDGLSKQPDGDDWETTQEFFAFLNNIWGPFTIDRFADNINSNLSRFNSKFHCPGTEGVDAFSTSWEAENNYLVPPVYLIPRLLEHMKTSRAAGVLVLPYWSSAVFWPLIIKVLQCSNRSSSKPCILKIQRTVLNRGQLYNG